MFIIYHLAFSVSLRPWLCLIPLLLLLAFPAHARINVVTLPDRHSVQLTIYNSADLTLVKETRFLTFRKGLNRLEFSWANTLIDPTSVEFRALTHASEVDVLDVSFPPRVSNTLEWRIQSTFAGEVQVEIRYFTSGLTWKADYVVEANQNENLMDLAGAVKVTNRSGEDYENAQVRLVVGVIRLVEEIAQLAQPGKPAAFKQTVRKELESALDRAEVWNRQLTEERRSEIIKEELSEYFLYTVAGRDTIPNGWAKRLPSFKVQAVPITSYYKCERGFPGARFHLSVLEDRTLNGFHTLHPGGYVILPRIGSVSLSGVNWEQVQATGRINLTLVEKQIKEAIEASTKRPATVMAEYVDQTPAPARKTGQAIRYYRFKNDRPSKLGNEPLPDGEVLAFRFISDDRLYACVGKTQTKYIPLNEQVDLELGPDPEVLVKPTLMNWEKLNLRFDAAGDVKGWTLRETWEMELQNSKEIEVVVDFRCNFPGDWSLATQATYEKVDANKVKFVLPLKPGEKQKLAYVVTTNHGLNVTK